MRALHVLEVFTLYLVPGCGLWERTSSNDSCTCGRGGAPQETRDFFRSFFSLSAYHWQGFLSARLSFPELIAFGLSLFVNASNPARLNLLRMGVPGLVAMLIELARIGL